MSKSVRTSEKSAPRWASQSQAHLCKVQTNVAAQKYKKCRNVQTKVHKYTIVKTISTRHQKRSPGHSQVGNCGNYLHPMLSEALRCPCHHISKISRAIALLLKIFSTWLASLVVIVLCPYEVHRGFKSTSPLIKVKLI